MEKFTANLLSGLYAELQEVAIESENELQQYEKSYYIAEQKIRQLKEFMQNYSFKDTEEEIRFFKEIKPQFHKEVLYFVELFNIEAVKPFATEEGRRQHYQKVLERLMDFFDQNREFYNYYRTGKTFMDKVYFVRTDLTVPLRPQYALDLDMNFSTPYSRILAEVQAYEQLCSYLNTALYKKDNSDDAPLQATKKKGLTWSGSKVALVELAVALYFSGSVNFGKGGFKRFIEEIESSFNVQLGNVYRVFLGMVIRKKDPTPFLHHLEQTFIRKLEERSI